MTDWHPEPGRLERFMRGELQAADCQEIVVHLLSGCEPCRRLARQSFPCAQAEPRVATQLPRRWQDLGGATYRALFDRVVPRVWQEEVSLLDARAVAPGLLEELKRHPHERRLLLVRNSRRFRTWPLGELVIEEAFRAGFKDPAEAVDLGRLGVAIAEALEPQQSTARLVEDLRGRARAILANALRISGDLNGAAAEFAAADRHLSLGSGDQVERARFLELTAQLAGEHRQFDRSLGLLGRAIRIYRAHGERHRLGRALVSRGFQLSEKGDLNGAIASLEHALKHVDAESDPRLYLAAKHNLILSFYQSGRYHQALNLVPETRALHQRLGNIVDLTRFDWLQARISRDSGDTDAAEEILDGVKRFFVERQIAHDAALVSLDLAMIYLRQGRAAELKRLTAEMLTIFHSLRIHREAIAALVLFQRAVELERATLGLVRDLAAYLKTCRHDPHLPFRPSANA